MTDGTENDGVKPAPHLAYGPTKIAAFTKQILDLLENRLSAGITQNGGTASLEMVAGIVSQMRQTEDTELVQLINHHWEEIRKTVEEVQWQDERRYPLERLIVSHFSPRLAPRGDAPVQGQNLSRRVIPAFLAALSQMIGKELLNDYEERCRTIVDHIQTRAGDTFEWRMVYSDHNANLLAQDIIVYIAQYFRDIHKRRLWMIDIFTRNMPPPRTAAEADWQFDNLEFHILVGALYDDLFQAMKDAEAMAALQARYGEERIATLIDVEHGLAQDRAACL